MALKHADFWSADNVKTFNGLDVTNGEMDLSDSEYEDVLDEIYEPIDIGGMRYNVGSTLRAIDPVAFRCDKGDYESSLQSDLEGQLNHENDSGIEWLDDELLEEDEEGAE